MNRAVAAAESAFPAWSALDAKERASMVRALARKLRERAPSILELEVRDTGNTMGKMRRDVSAAGDALDFFAGMGIEMKGETMPSSAGNLHLTIREPYGVVGRIIPFNHPIKFACHALAAPLMAGNTIVVKPSEQSPLSAPILGEICREVMPAGVVNIVTGNGVPAGDALARHPAVKRLAFIGSVPTGMAIQRAAAESGVKHVTLELGGKNPLIAFPDVDRDKVADMAVEGMNFAWQGQSCGSTSRLLLHESIYQDVLERVVSESLCASHRRPADPEVADGPVEFGPPIRACLRHGEVRQIRRRAPDDRRQAAGREPVQARLLAGADGVRRCGSRQCASRGRRSSARCCRCFAGARKKRRSPSPTRRNTV